MPKVQHYYPQCPEALIVSLARGGDRDAFTELVNRRQSGIRQLMRRCCHDETLADDLAQQVFLKVWLEIRKLREPEAFGGWLKKLAISIWLQHVRKNDALKNADDLLDSDQPQQDTSSIGLDLNEALAALPSEMRLCIVLSYHEGMSHREIAELTDYPLGTVKSHINRGTQRLQKTLAAYQAGASGETQIEADTS